MNELLLSIRDLNIKLHRKFVKISDDEVYTSSMLHFLNGLDGLRVKFFSEIEEINGFFKNIDDIKTFEKFYDEMNGNINNCLLIYDMDCGLQFIDYGGFQEFVEDILIDSDDEEIIEFNKYIMGKIIW